MLESSIRAAFEDKSLGTDFSVLTQILTSTLGNFTKDGSWVLSDEAFKEFRKNFLAQTAAMRVKMMRELGAPSD